MVKQPQYVVRDDRAVSEVIGVILMVAITVILAAVIGTFVLGLGANVPEDATQASLSMSVTDDTADEITISHEGGDPVPKGSIVTISGVQNATLSSELTAGTSQTLAVDDLDGDHTVRVAGSETDQVIFKTTLNFG